MRVACVGYRSWALNIYHEISQDLDHIFLIIKSKEQYDIKLIHSFNPDLILFYGWSWEVSHEIYSNYRSLMLHPSPLPKYRGGSPLQNQIIANEVKSMVSIFQIERDVDAGPIFSQKELSLEGDIDQIFLRIETIGTELTKGILQGSFTPIAQDHSIATYCKRRKPEDSEITIQDLLEKDSKYIFNKVRMLTGPYPRAYIKMADGKKLLLNSVEIF
jgi:methionyl-tRNA formyltransferase